MDHPSLPAWATIFILIALNESIIEYIFGSVKGLYSYLPLLSLAVGVFLCFAFQVSIFSLAGLESNNPFWDFLFTGFIVSRGANFVNDLAQKLLNSK